MFEYILIFDNKSRNKSELGQTMIRLKPPTPDH